MIRMLLIFLLGVSPLLSESNDISYFTASAKHLRFSARDRDQKKQKTFVEDVIRKLPDYGRHKNIEKAVLSFVSKVLPKAQKYRAINAKDADFNRVTTTLVYLIVDQKGAISYVVKLFPIPQKRHSQFLPELSGMALLEELRLPHVGGVKPLALGRCRYGKTSYGLLLESVATGQRLDKFLKAIGECKKGSPERRIKLEAAEKVFSLLATAFYELHSPAKAKFCYTHGDAHMKNIFVDVEKNQMILIDTSRLHNSVNRKGKPLKKNGLCDIERVCRSLQRFPTVTDEEKSHLAELFLKSYESQGGKDGPLD